MQLARFLLESFQTLANQHSTICVPLAFWIWSHNCVKTIFDRHSQIVFSIFKNVSFCRAKRAQKTFLFSVANKVISFILQSSFPLSPYLPKHELISRKQTIHFIPNSVSERAFEERFKIHLRTTSRKIPSGKNESISPRKKIITCASLTFKKGFSAQFRLWIIYLRNFFFFRSISIIKIFTVEVL